MTEMLVIIASSHTSLSLVCINAILINVIARKAPGQVFCAYSILSSIIHLSEQICDHRAHSQSLEGARKTFDLSNWRCVHLRAHMLREVARTACAYVENFSSQMNPSTLTYEIIPAHRRSHFKIHTLISNSLRRARANGHCHIVSPGLCALEQTFSMFF